MAEYIVDTNASGGFDGEKFVTGAKRGRVTRCGDCPKFRADWSPTYCTLHNHLATKDGFCAWAPKDDTPRHMV